MLKNYLLLALRNQRRHAGYALLNLTGLALGMACCLLIALYVRDELTFDRFHENADRIHRLAMGSATSGYGGDTEGIAKVPAPWGPHIVENVPAVETMTRFVFYGQALVESEQQQAFQSGGMLADPSVFDVFSFEMLRGDPATALTEPNTIVITQTMAEAFFGDADPIGETLLFDNELSYTVTGVLADVPANSHIRFRFLVTLAGDPPGLYDLQRDVPVKEDWRQNQFYTYLLLRPDADPSTIASAFLATLGDVYSPEQLAGNFSPFTQALPDIYLTSNLFREIGPLGNATYVYLFGALALFILLIACINYMNLATARSAQRAKEVGVRKVNGASRGMLMRQFLTEAVLQSMAALTLGVALASLLLPVFNDLAGKDLVLNLWQEWPLLAGIVGLGLVVGLLTGSYPALVLSAFRPVKVLKGNTILTSGATLRRGLVVFQFAISAFLLIATGVIGSQLRYIQDKNLGFDKEQIVTLQIRDTALTERLPTIKAALRDHPGVIAVAASGNLPGGGDWGIPYEADGVDPDNRPSMRILAVDHDFMDVYGMNIAAGRGFSEALASDSAGAYIVSETAAARFEWADPLTKTMDLIPPQIQRGPVVGVVEDFHFRSLHEAVEPIMLFIPPNNWFGIISIKISPDRMDETLAFIERTWTTFQPDYPYTFAFFDEGYDALYRGEQRVQTLFNVFTALAILIACLGLFGLAAFTAERRTKEIGVRKVLGASVGGIVALLTKDFARLVLIAFVVAIPLAYFAAQRWLDGFAYHTDLTAGIFLLAGGLILGIAVLTISYQALRAALTDPVKSLRYE